MRGQVVPTADSTLTRVARRAHRLRRTAAAWILVAVAAGGCTALVNFDDVRFEDSGGTGAATTSASSGASAGASVSGSGGGSCDAGCNGPCESCDLPGSEGQCTKLAAGVQGECAAGVCDGAGTCASGETIWGLLFGGLSAQVARGVVSAGTSGAILAGFFNGAIDLGGGNNATADAGYFLARFGDAGGLTWAEQGGGLEGPAYFGVDMRDDKVVAAGLAAADSVTVDSDTASGGPPAGSQVLQTPGGQATAYGVAIAPDGGAFAVGEFTGTLANETATGGLDIFVAHFNPDTTLDWLQGYGGTTDESAVAVAVDTTGHAYVTGVLVEPTQIGGSTAIGKQDVFVLEVDAAGTELWSKRFGSIEDDVARGIAVDPSGNVLVTGTTHGTIDFGAGPVPLKGVADAFVLKLDSSGKLLWAKTFGASTTTDSGQAISADPRGNVIVAGAMNGNVDFGGGNLISGGGFDVFVAKFSADGTHLWSRSFGDAADQIAHAVDGRGGASIVVSGEAEGVVDFGRGPLAAMDNDGFVVVLAP